MRKKMVLLFLIITTMLSACSGTGKEDDRILSDVDGQIREVKNFTQYDETELPTEEITEPITEVVTEPETEPETDPVTELVEQPYSKEYDFSDFRVLQAVLKKKGGIGSTPYTSTVVQDYENATRTQTVITSDGTVEVVFKADKTSGETNKELKISYASETTMEDIRGILLAFDNGLNENNVDKFMRGEYNGTEKAPFIGLYDAEYSDQDGIAHVKMVKNAVENGSVPFWTGTTTTDIGQLTKSDKYSGQMTNGGDSFGELLQSLEFERVTMRSSVLSNSSVVTNERGDVISSQSGFIAEYDCSNGDQYMITADCSSDLGGIQIRCRADGLNSVSVMNIANHIYQAFYEGSIDVSYDLTTGAYQTNDYKVELLEDGYLISIGT